MDTPLYLAHLAKDGREQTVLDHLTGTAKLAGEFAQPFGGRVWIEMVYSPIGCTPFLSPSLAGDED